MVTHITKLIGRLVRSTRVLVLLVGLPTVLVVMVGWPLPDRVPDPAAVWLALKQENIPADVVVNTLAVVVWLLWVQLAWAILWDLAVNTRRVAAGLDIRSAPFVATGIESLATRLASGTMAVSVLVASPEVASALPSNTAQSTSQEYSDVAPAGDLTAATKHDPVSDQRPVWKVARGDSAWSVAESVLGDGSRFGELAALNTHVSSARDVVPGIRLILPAGSQVPDDRNPFAAHRAAEQDDQTRLEEAKTPGAAFEEVEQPAVPESVMVVKGDHLWGLASTHLASTNGATPSDQEVSSFVERIIALNPDVVENPDLIFPGEVFQLPTEAQTDEPDSVAESSASSGYLPSAEITVERFDHLWGLSEARLEEAHGRTPTNLEILNHVNAVIELNDDIVEDPNLIFPGEVFTFPAIGTAPVTQPLTPSAENEPTTPVGASPAETTVVPGQLESPEVPAEAAFTETTSSRSPNFVGITGALLAATGLLAAYRILRRRRASFGEVAAASKTTDLERAMMQASDMPLLRWAGQEISTLVESINLEEVTSGPVLVEVSDKGLEVLWDTPQDRAPHPWEATDGGAAWRLLYDAQASIPADELPAGIPALVTLGTRLDGGTVLADLEAFGSLSVAGDQTLTENTLRSFALEFGSCEELSNVELITVGIDVDGSESLVRVQSRSESEALSEIKATVSQFEEMISSSGARDSFGLRAKTGVGPDALVVLVSADRCANVGELLRAAVPRRGVALVLAGDVSAAGAHLRMEPDGMAVLNPVGLRVKAASMPRETAAQLSVLLDEASVLPDDGDSTGTNDGDVWDLVMAAQPATAAEKPDHIELREVVGEAFAPVTGEPADLLVVEPRNLASNALALETSEGSAGCKETKNGHSLELAGGELGSMNEIDLKVQPGIVDAPVDMTAAGEILGSDDEPAAEAECRVVVSVLGVPHVEGFPELTTRQVALLGFLASSPEGAATAESVLNHLWADSNSARTRKTLANLESQTRGIVGREVLPNSPRNAPLSTTATTDYLVFCDLVTRSNDVSRNDAIGLLSEALGMIRGTPFDHQHCGWARSIEIYDPARQMIEAAGLRLTDLALEAGDTDAAREGVRFALLALGVNEPLYRARMRIDAYCGDIAAVVSTYEELERQLALFFDDASPSAQTRQLRDSLVPASEV